jgi:hypothetical protein
MIARLSQDSGAQVIYRTDFNQFEITGSKEQIQCIVQIIKSLPISQVRKLHVYKLQCNLTYINKYRNIISL